jgi:hypothetical protein
LLGKIRIDRGEDAGIAFNDIVEPERVQTQQSVNVPQNLLFVPAALQKLQHRSHLSGV